MPEAGNSDDKEAITRWILGFVDEGTKTRDRLRQAANYYESGAITKEEFISVARQISEDWHYCLKGYKTTMRSEGKRKVKIYHDVDLGMSHWLTSDTDIYT